VPWLRSRFAGASDPDRYIETVPVLRERIFALEVSAEILITRADSERALYERALKAGADAREVEADEQEIEAIFSWTLSAMCFVTGRSPTAC
jgi:hypothetical protein